MSFDRHGIRHLSPSSLSLWTANPALWVGKYLLRWKDDGGPAMFRGTAVEAGLSAWLHGASSEHATDTAWGNFEMNAQGQADDEWQQAREEIAPMLEQAIRALSGRHDSRPFMQKKVQHWVDGLPVPVIGYLDFQWPEIEVLDLKTTNRIPSSPKPDHAAQVGLYCRCERTAGRLLYVSKSKSASYTLSEEEASAAFEPMIRAAKSLQYFLSHARDGNDALRMLPINTDDFRWSDTTLKLATAGA
jgi:hypothetical protein